MANNCSIVSTMVACERERVFMILGEEKIREYIESGLLEISPLEEDQIRPASIDLSLDEELLAPLYDGYYNFQEEGEMDKGSVKGFLPPGKFTLGSTQEYIKLPNNLSGIIYGRSSIGRSGLIVENAGWVDPGFEGNITLELFNCTKWPMQLHEGMKICQMVLVETHGVVRGYGEQENKYQGQTGPTPSRIYEEM